MAAAQSSPVADLELECPASELFLLRATVPVPPGTVSEAGPHGQFEIVDGDGSSVPAQVEVVARYSEESAGASVIEVVAPVHTPEGAQVGERIVFELNQGSEPAHLFVPAEDSLSALTDGTTPVAPEVAGLLADPTAIVVRSRDVHGNVYERLPLSEEGYFQVKKYGPYVTQVRSYDVMTPVGPPAGLVDPLPHLFGVHTYWTVLADQEVLLLDLRVHNGFANTNNRSELDDPLGEVYFEGIELQVPDGWVVVRSFEDPVDGVPFVGPGGDSVLPLIRPLADGKLHWISAGAHLVRRLALCRAGSEAKASRLLALEGRAMVADTDSARWSWSNEATGSFLTQGVPLPSLEHVGWDAIRQGHAGRVADLAQLLLDSKTTVAEPLLGGDLGWATPAGVAYGGATGGIGIELFPGVDIAQARSLEGLRLTRLLHRLHAERQENVLFRQDGESTHALDWIEEPASGEAYVPVNFYMTWIGPEDPMGIQSPPTFQVEHVQANGLAPAYQAALEPYEAHDLQHLIRYTSHLKTLAWLMNDSLAKDGLCAQADLAQLTYHPYPRNEFGGMSPTGMLADLVQAGDHPGKGVSVDRGEGWAMDTRIAAYALGDGERRAREFPEFVRFAEMLVIAQMPCSGHFMAVTKPKVLDGKYRGAQSYETSILENAVVGVLETALRGRDSNLEAWLENFLVRHYEAFTSPQSWDSQLGGPYIQYAVAPLGEGSDPFCVTGNYPSDGNTGSIDPYQTWCTLAHGYLRTGDSFYLSKAKEMIGGPLLEGLESDGLLNLGNRAALLYVAQKYLP